jgi:tetratricopeptide (TPR) repeat protein
LAYVLISNNEFVEAKLLAEEIIKQTPDDPFVMLLAAIRYHIAYTLNKLGRVSEAKAELKQALLSNLIFNEREAAVKLLSSI